MHKIKRIFVVYKRSVYQKYVLDEGHEKMQELIEKKHISAATLIAAHEKHMAALNSILKVLDACGIPYDTETRNHLRQIKGYDLILTVGGDGTFLYSAHVASNQLIMGINSAPSVSVGALCSVKHTQFPQKLDEILRGRYRVKELPKIRISLNGHKIATEAINDVLYTNVSPAATSRYLIRYQRIREEHKSSGVWVATSTGSTAAINAAGGQKMKPLEKRLQYLVREPYQGIYNTYKLTGGFIPKDKKLTIVNKMAESKLFIDGPRDFVNLHYGDELEFMLSPKTLKVIE
jgi:NAD+ kinase